MNDSQPLALMGQRNDIAQVRHPTAGLVSYQGHPRAGTSLAKANHTPSHRRNHNRNDPPAPPTDARNCPQPRANHAPRIRSTQGARVGAIGDHITGADHMTGRKTVSNLCQGFTRLQIGIRGRQIAAKSRPPKRPIPGSSPRASFLACELILYYPQFFDRTGPNGKLQSDAGCRLLDHRRRHRRAFADVSILFQVVRRR